MGFIRFFFFFNLKRLLFRRFLSRRIIIPKTFIPISEQGRSQTFQNEGAARGLGLNRTHRAALDRPLYKVLFHLGGGWRGTGLQTEGTFLELYITLWNIDLPPTLPTAPSVPKSRLPLMVDMLYLFRDNPTVNVWVTSFSMSARADHNNKKYCSHMRVSKFTNYFFFSHIKNSFYLLECEKYRVIPKRLVVFMWGNKP